MRADRSHDPALVDGKAGRVVAIVDRRAADVQAVCLGRSSIVCERSEFWISGLVVRDGAGNRATCRIPAQIEILRVRCACTSAIWRDTGAPVTEDYRILEIQGGSAWVDKYAAVSPGTAVLFVRAILQRNGQWELADISGGAKDRSGRPNPGSLTLECSLDLRRLAKPTRLDIPRGRRRSHLPLTYLSKNAIERCIASERFLEMLWSSPG